jgi:hypothetical protein
VTRVWCVLYLFRYQRIWRVARGGGLLVGPVILGPRLNLHIHPGYRSPGWITDAVNLGQAAVGRHEGYTAGCGCQGIALCIIDRDDIAGCGVSTGCVIFEYIDGDHLSIEILQCCGFFHGNGSCLGLQELGITAQTGVQFHPGRGFLYVHSHLNGSLLSGRNERKRPASGIHDLATRIISQGNHIDIRQCFFHQVVDGTDNIRRIINGEKVGVING